MTTVKLVIGATNVLHRTVAGNAGGFVQLPVSGPKLILPIGPAWATSTGAPPAGAGAESWIVNRPVPPTGRLSDAGDSAMVSAPTVICDTSVEPPSETSSWATVPTAPPVRPRMVNVSHTWPGGMTRTMPGAKTIPSRE